jgi:DNA repair exonuclease SbcCD ATPase subunit
MHGEVTNTEAIRQALRHHRETLEAAPGTVNVESPLKQATLSKTASLAKNRKEIITYSTVLIKALQEAIDYDQGRQHNQERPPLFVDNKKYLSDISALTKELKKLNRLLKGTTKPAARDKSAHVVRDYIHLYICLLAVRRGR